MTGLAQISERMGVEDPPSRVEALQFVMGLSAPEFYALAFSVLFLVAAFVLFLLYTARPKTGETDDIELHLGDVVTMQSKSKQRSDPEAVRQLRRSRMVRQPLGDETREAS